MGVVVAAALAASCGPRTPVLASRYSSPHALGEAVLGAVAQNNPTALHELALSEQEFREHVWPELPASRPERNLPFSYVWGDLHQKSEQSLQQTLARHAGKRYTLTGVRFAGETTRYPSYTVRRETVLQVRDETGAVTDLRLFGSSIEKDGGWRVFSYVVDD